MNITDPVWRNSHAWPERVAVLFDGHTVTYRALRQTTERVAARLTAAGVERHDVVGLGLANPLAYLVLVLAIARLGAIVTPFKPHWPAETRQELPRRNRVRWLVLDDPAGAVAAVDAGITCLAGRDLLAAGGGFGRPAPLLSAESGGDDCWLIALSSGTTGVYKSIPQTHARSALAWTMVTDGADEQPDRVLVFVDLAATMGLGAAMRQLYVGGAVVLTRNLRPASVLETIKRDQPTRLVTSTGNMTDLVRFAEQAEPASRSACASLKSVSVTGSAVPPALRVAITTHICPNLQIPYGATETGRLATATMESLKLHPASAGRIHPWTQAQAVDDQHRVLPPGQQGALRFRTPFMAEGYLGDPQADARTFREGWCYTGDTGRIDAAGYLTLGARTDHVLNLGGRKLDPARIERVLDAQPGVRESVVVVLERAGGKPDLVAVVVAQGPIDAPALKQACRAHLGTEYVPAAIVTTDALPRNAAGKVMRRELVARLRALTRAPLAAKQAEASPSGGGHVT